MGELLPSHFEVAAVSLELVLFMGDESRPRSEASETLHVGVRILLLNGRTKGVLLCISFHLFFTFINWLF